MLHENGWTLRSAKHQRRRFVRGGACTRRASDALAPLAEIAAPTTVRLEMPEKAAVRDDAQGNAGVALVSPERAGSASRDSMRIDLQPRRRVSTILWTQARGEI